MRLARVTCLSVAGWPQYTYDEHSGARGQITGSCLSDGSNDTTTVVVKIQACPHVVVRPLSGG